MKNPLLLLSIPLLFVSLSVSAQLSTRTVEKKNGLVEYDSSLSYQKIPANLDPATLVGQELLFPTRNPGVGFSGFRETEGLLTKKKSVRKSITSPPKVEFKDVQEKVFTIVEAERVQIYKGLDESSDEYGYDLVLQEKGAGKVIYYSVSQGKMRSDILYFSSHLAYLKKKYVGHNLYLMDEHYGGRSNVNLLKNYEPYTFEKGDVYRVTEISMLSLPDQPFSVPHLIVMDTKGTELALRLFGTDPNLKGPTAGMFRDEQEQNQYLAEIQAKEAKKIAEQQQLDADHKAWRDERIRKWGPALGNKIADRQVELGMTKQMCLEAWGSPESISQLQAGDKIIEVLLYDYTRILKFVDNKLIGIML